jgi:hypothetical protein
MSKKNKNIDDVSVIFGSGNDANVKTLRDVLTFKVSIKSINKQQGSSLSETELNKLRVGNGLGQHPSVSYGTSGTSKRKPSKKRASGSESHE